MKNNIFLRIATGVALWCGIGSTQSCSFLDIDQYIYDLPSMDSVFMRKETTLQYLANVYSFLPDDGYPMSSSGTPWIPVADECVCTYQEADGRAYFNYFSNDNMSAYDKYFQRWAPYYQGIRNAGVFLMRVKDCEELSSTQLKELIGEAHFLRAYFYFELMKAYGPVPLAPREGFSLDTPMEELLVPRNTWDQCVSFVKEELMLAAENLPETRPDIDFGKPTKGAAYAVLSRFALYDASPLYNGNSMFSDFTNKKTGVPYFNSVANNGKWAEAAWAAKQVIESGQYELYRVDADRNTPELPAGFSEEDKRNFPDGAGGIDPLRSYKQLFDGTVQASDNKEVIFGVPSTGLKSWVRYMAPYIMGDKGASTFNITQELVDAYYMVDGRTPENPSSQYPCDNSVFSPQDILFSGYKIPSGTNGWYLNREARFYATVGFCNSQYYGTSTTNTSRKDFPCLFYADDSKNGMNIVISNTGRDDQYCMTGYLCRKYMHNEDNFQDNGLVRHKIWMTYRLAEIYLNYAEALNELNGSYTVNNEGFSRNAAEIRRYFNLVRFRAGLPGMTVAESQDQAVVRQLIRRERQVELAWEGQRYFDCRRWLIADEQENKPIYGVDVTQKAANKTSFFRKVVVKPKTYIFKTFTKRQYFWPIPQDEIVRNPNLSQSPNW